jgi:hypothetical protein
MGKLPMIESTDPADVSGRRVGHANRSGDSVETVQLQCGSCMNMMAISAEHLGQQVQCPHCRSVVQTPPASAFGLAPPGPDPTVSAPPPPSYASEPEPITVPEQPESIFAEAAPSDDLFDEAPRTPKIHMPDDNHQAEEAAVAVEEAEPEEEYEEPADLSAMRARLASARQSSSVAPTILVFLVPYAICTTGFIAYLLMNWPSIDRLDYLPDPRMLKAMQKAGPVALPAHGIELAANRKIPLGGSVRVGDIEIRPVQVKRLLKGDLELDFIAKNLSSEPMTPIEMDFFAGANKGNFRPYTFLSSNLRTPADDMGAGGYGGYLQYFDDPALVRERSRADLAPGAEEHITLTTEVKSRDYVTRIKGGNYTWRLQVRRGNVNYRGGEIPVTAVVGVQFGESDIKEK